MPHNKQKLVTRIHFCCPTIWWRNWG